MSAVHKLTFPPYTNPRYVVPTSDGVYYAFPFTKTTIGVFYLNNLDGQPLYLEGHRQNINALAFGNVRKSTSLCSAADDYVIVWNVNNSFKKSAAGEQIKGQIIGTTLGEIHHCCFSTDDTLVAVCMTDVIYILKSNEEKTLAILEGHRGVVNAALFSPHYTATLVSIAEDRTFIVWDVSKFTLVYQSTIISSSPFISIAMNWYESQFTIGSSDGILRTYDLSDGNNFRPLYQIDIEKILLKEKEKVERKQLGKINAGPVRVTKRGTWKMENDDVVTEDSTEYGNSIISLKFAYPLQDNTTHDELAPQFQNSVVHEILQASSPVILVATTGYLLQINPKNHKVLSLLSLQDSLPSGKVSKKREVVGASRYCEFTQGSGYEIWALLGSYFENKMHILQWHMNSLDTVYCHGDDTTFQNVPEHQKISDDPSFQNVPEHQKISDDSSFQNVPEHKKISDDPSFQIVREHQKISDDASFKNVTKHQKTSDVASTSNTLHELSIVATAPLCEKSPLHSEMIPTTKNDKSKKSQSKKSVSMDLRRKSDPMNQFLTFNNKVKSSGYSETTTKRTMFQPMTSKATSASSLKKKASSARSLQENYPADCQPCRKVSKKIMVAEKPTPINSIAFSKNGKNVACALSNGMASIYKHPIVTNDCFSLLVHDGIVNSVTWSHSGNFLLTASDDKTVALWAKGCSDPVMRIDKTANNLTNKDQHSPERSNMPFTKEIKHAQFFYMDKFILLASAGVLYLYKYHLDKGKDEIRRYMSKSFYKRVERWETDSVTLTCVSAVNAFHSHVVICAGSNRNIELFDMNEGKLAQTIVDSHSRPVHSISLNKGSSYATQPQSAYNLFASAALADCIKLWDVRTQKCVQRLEGHMNKAHNCGLEVSPCGTYLASGSEDKCVYIFDLRTGTYCEKLRGHTNVVSDVAYHPAYPYLLTGSLGGTLLSYLPK